MSEKVTRQNFDPSKFLTAKASAPKVVRSEVLYDRTGQEVADEKDAAAKAVNGHHYVRFSTGGSDRGDMYDPANFPDADFTSENRQVGKLRYAFQKVPVEAFDQYVMYLTNRTLAHLRVAERFAK